jgi:hypothetical protein
MTSPQELCLIRLCNLDVFYQTEFRSQEPEWAKRPAIANRIEFCTIGG